MSNANRPRRAGGRPRQQGSQELSRFTFVNSYSVVEQGENPLVSGETEEIEAGSERAANIDRSQQLHIDLLDLIKCKKSFQRENDDPGSTNKELTQKEFIEAFRHHAGPALRNQLGYLFMKIDCNCDGRVSFEELLVYVLSQDRNEQKPQLDDMKIVRADMPDCPPDENHREPVACTIFVPKCSSYVSGGRDGTLRVWSTSLRLQLNLPISPDAKPTTTVNSMTLLPNHLAKLAVASSDRMITLYELADTAGGSKRWSVWGRAQLKDMPLSICGFTHVTDKAPCLAIGTDTGSVSILDAKKLLSLLKDDRFIGEANKNGGIPFKLLERAIILTLSLHIDWVSHLAYEPSVSALVSGSLDSLLCVTQLDWPAGAVPSSNANQMATVRADPKHCRSMCTIRAHHKGVIHFQLMNVSSRKLCATCSHERTVCIWNIDTGDLVRNLVGHKSQLRQLAFDETTNLLFSVAVDGEMRTWEMISYTQLQTIRPSNDLEKVSSISFNATLQCLVTSTRRLMLWHHPRKTQNEEVLAASLLAPEGHRNPLVSVLYSYQFFLVISGDESGLICVWDVRTGRQVFRFEYGSRITALLLDNTGRKLIIGDAKGYVSLWNYSSGEKLKTVTTEDNTRRKVEVSALYHIVLPKVNYFVSVGWNRDVWMWPDRKDHGARGQAKARKLVGHVEDITCVTFCPPNFVCTGAYDGTVIMHCIESGKVQKRVAMKRRDHFTTDDFTTDDDDPDFLRTNAVETLGIIDSERLRLPNVGLAVGTADGYLSLFSAVDMHLLDEFCAATPGEALKHLCTEDSATLIVTGDSAGRVTVWDISKLQQRWPSERDIRFATVNGQTSALSPGSAKQLYSWRAHAKSIEKVQYLTGIEGIISASSDCTVRLWTLSGEQVGVFGQSEEWVLDSRGTWFDDTCHAIEGTDDDKVLASERRIQELLSKRHLGSESSSPRKTIVQSEERLRERSEFFRLQREQFDDIQKLGSMLNQKKKQPVEPTPTAKDIFASLPPVKTIEEERRKSLTRAASHTYLTQGETNSAIGTAVYKQATLWRAMPKQTTADSLRPLLMGNTYSMPQLLGAADHPTRFRAGPTRFRKPPLT